MNTQPFFSLNETDLQTVAVEELGRNLSDNEIQKVGDRVTAYINWYEAITQAIQEEVS